MLGLSSLHKPERMHCTRLTSTVAKKREHLILYVQLQCSASCMHICVALTLHVNPSKACINKKVMEVMQVADGCQAKLQMGLGKTVELLACLLAHPFKPSPQQPPPKPNSGSNKVHCTAQAFRFQAQSLHLDAPALQFQAQSLPFYSTAAGVSNT